MELLDSPNSLEDLEQLLPNRIGVMLLKPDSLREGVGQQILEFIKQGLPPEAKLGGTFKIDSISSESIPKIYPALNPVCYPTVAWYLSSGPSLMTVYTGDGTVNLEQEMIRLKGKRMLDWTDEELDGIKDIRRGIRYMIPVPGMKEAFVPILEQIKDSRRHPEKPFWLGDHLYQTYCQNLVHSPEGARETIAMLELLPENQMVQALGEDLYAMVQMYKELAIHQSP